MSSRYCDWCKHEKKEHVKRRGKCKVKGCDCLEFDRGARLDVFGRIIKRGRW